MRIGLFTDTYRPSINGIVFVVETLKQRLEEEGHEVFIFCPAKSIRRNGNGLEFSDDEDHIVRFPSIKGAFLLALKKRHSGKYVLSGQLTLLPSRDLPRRELS